MTALRSLLVVACSALLTAVAFGQEARPKLMVFAAISLREALTEIAADFEKTENVNVEFSFGASGQLASQIEGGAEADVFISAADAQVTRLAKAGLVNTSRAMIASNTLVLIVPADAKAPIVRFEDLASPALKRVAIGEPKSVPAGMYAMQAITHLKLESSLANRLVLGANVRQVLDYVARGEVDAGIVYATDAAEAGEKVRVVARADATWHEPILYQAVVVTGTKSADLSGRFIGALTGESGKATLTRHGFTMPTPDSTRHLATRPAK